MKDRWITFLLAVGAFVAFYRFFIGSVGIEPEEFSRPLSTETRANGYLALRRWLETEGIPVSELRHRYDWLARAPGIPQTGNLLVSTVPHRRMARPSEVFALQEWVGQGNTLLVLAGLFDTPEWGIPDTGTPGTIRRLSNIGIDVHEAEPQQAEEAEAPAEPQGEFVNQRLEEPKRHALRPLGAHALTEGVREVRAQSEYPAGVFDPWAPGDEATLAVMQDVESGLGALWVTWIGGGTVIVSGYGSVFTNKLLAEADNAALAANIVAAHVQGGGHVIFDDMHQGAASFYDAEAFFGDPRLHASFWWVVALWLVWVLGSTRLPPPAARPAPVREEALVNAAGHLFARVVGRRRAAERMFAAFFGDLARARGGLPGEAHPWGWIRAGGMVSVADVDRLEALHRRVAAGRRVDLVDLHNRLQQIRKQLA